MKLQEHFEYICEYQRKLLGENDSVFLRTRSRLAEILFETNQKEKSLVIIKDTMKSQLEVVGPSHIDYLYSKSILASLTEDYSECYEIFMELKYSLNKTFTKHSILYQKTLINTVSKLRKSSKSFMRREQVILLLEAVSYTHLTLPTILLV